MRIFCYNISVKSFLKRLFFGEHKQTFLVLLFLCLYSVTITYAVPPTSPYLPGESLDPSCAPGDINCLVQVIPDQTGNSGDFLTTDGTTTSWQAVPETTPGGSNTQFQFNNSGEFGGTSGFTWDSTNGSVSLTGTLDSIGSPGMTISKQGFVGSTSRQISLSVEQLSYTGTVSTIGIDVLNQSASTATGTFNSTNTMGNFSVRALTNSTTTGNNYGVHGSAINGALSIGVLGTAQGSSSSKTYIGVGGFALHGTGVDVGVLGVLQSNLTAFPTITGDHAALFDNGTQSANILTLRDNGTEVFTVQNGGTVFANTIAASSGTPDALCWDTSTGQITHNTSTATCTVSSARFKQNIIPITDSILGKLIHLSPSTFMYNNTNIERIGLIAEEVLEIEPRLVFFEADGTTVRGVRYEDLSVYTLKGIQELDIKLNNLNNLITGNSIKDSFISWFDNVGNGIRNIFADQLSTKKLCIEEVCIDKTQLIEIINNSGAASPVPNTNEVENIEEVPEQSQDEIQITEELQTITENEPQIEETEEVAPVIEENPPENSESI